MSNWCCQNGLFLNCNKTVLINFHTPQNKLDHSLYFNLDNKSIRNVETTKFLGLNISSDLDWHCHASYITSKLNNICYLIIRCRTFVDIGVLKSVYYGYFQPVSTYGIMFWGGSPIINRIFIIQKRILRLMTFTNRGESAKPLFKSTGILTLPSLYIYECVTFVFNNKHMFTKNSDVHCRDTRHMDDLRLQRHRLKLYHSPQQCLPPLCKILQCIT